jgi:SH3-like domain-containing protein
MPLIWTDPAPGKEGVSHYDHVIAETPLGRILLEWKSWKDHDDPCGHMPWDEFIVEATLDGTKAAVQDAWDRMAPKIVALSKINIKEGS